MAIPIATIVGYMVKSRLDAGQAAQRAAEEFDYFLKLSEAELTELSFACSRAFPTYKYWEWFSILKNLRNYGMSIPTNGNANGNGNDNDTQKSNMLLYVGIAAAVVLILGGMRE